MNIVNSNGGISKISHKFSAYRLNQLHNFVQQWPIACMKIKCKSYIILKPTQFSTVRVPSTFYEKWILLKQQRCEMVFAEQYPWQSACKENIWQLVNSGFLLLLEWLEFGGQRKHIKISKCWIMLTWIMSWKDFIFCWLNTVQNL